MKINDIMKVSKTLWQPMAAIVLCLPLLCMCNREKTDPAGKKDLTVTVTIDDPKVIITQEYDHMGLAWQENDAIRIEGSNCEVFSIDKEFSAHTAKFHGTRPEGNSFNVFYPSKYATTKELLAHDYSHQAQKGNGNTEHLEYNALAEDVKDLKNVSFNKVSGIVKISAKLPSGAKSVSALRIETEDKSEIFYVTNDALGAKTSSLSLSLSDITLDYGNILTAYMMVPWNEVNIPSGKELGIRVYAQDGSTYYYKKFTATSDMAIRGGECFDLDLSNTSALVDTYGIYKENPVLAGTPDQLKALKTVLGEISARVGEQKIYVKLTADINLSGVNWKDYILNPDGVQNIDFDGNGKTISNLNECLFENVYGDVYDLTLESANISASQACGICARRVGSGVNRRDGRITGVHVAGQVLGGSGTGVGGIAGILERGEISRCWNEAEIIGNANYVGGICGFIEKGKSGGTEGSRIVNCIGTGLVHDTNIAAGRQRYGGIVGGINGNEQVVEYCIATCNVCSGTGTAGICGIAHYDSSSKSDGYGHKCKVNKCIAWNPRIYAEKIQMKNYSPGAIVGFAATDNTYSDCVRRSDMVFSLNTEQTDRTKYPLDFWTLYDQENSDATHPLSVPCDYSTTYESPYHGKAAASGETASDVARRLGWDLNIWDLSKDIPAIKGMSSASGYERQKYVIPGDDIPNHDPVRPEGKSGWKKTVVEDGIIYWEFKGTDPVSGAQQFLHVSDIDLSKGYDLRYVYNSNQDICSNVMKKYNAIVSMNGGFGASQIFIKVDGTVYKDITQDANPDTGLPNWRNDGAICKSPEGRVFIANAIFSQDGDGQSEYGAQVQAQRKFYMETLFEMTDIISGSALLIDGYNPLGRTFIPDGVDYTKYQSNTEHPWWHQGTRHPRTAIAITGDNHLIMFVVNGRLSGCSGFSAKELTNFLIENFDPKYALNLDGGGSSTMCVKGLGDSSTHVVNWPCDNKICDHDGERTVQTFLYIVKK